MSEELIEVHNVYTLYELEADGSHSDTPLLSFFRPQDWGDSRWHYHYCTISLELRGTQYINHCHVWQEVERNSIEAFQAIASSLFMISMPGRTKELCDNTHLAEDDFWSKEWGEMPPYWYEDQGEDIYDYYGTESFGSS